MPTPAPYAHLTALVIDDMPMQQATLRGQLGMLGVGKIDQAGGADDAIRLIRTRDYGLILCDYHLNQKTDGQQLFEYLRDNALLKPDCLFFMVTAENGYASVMSTTEHKPDVYLLKPFTASDIEDRLKVLLERRSALLPINERLTRQDLAGAVQECDKLLARKDRWTMQALQIKGQTQLQLAQPDAAFATYGVALAQRPGLIWAQLGQARAHKAANRFEEAKAIAQEIMQTRDGSKSADAYDVVAQSLEAQGDAQGAYWALKDAAVAVPSVKRQRMLAESAYRNGDLAVAKECLTKVCAATRGTITAQPQDTLMLAQALVDLGETAPALALLADAATAQRNNPQFEGVAMAIRAQGLLKAGDTAGAAAAMGKARQGMRGARADFATVVMAKAELLAGDEAAGLQLMQQAVSADHESLRVHQLIRNALRQTGHEAQAGRVMEAATAAPLARVAEAKRLFIDNQIEAAIRVIDAAIVDYPENTAVLLQAAQINCLSLRRKKELSAPMIERVRLYLARLDKLMPLNDRVMQMQRYFQETLGSLSATASV